jgi:hypothetical protein
MASDFSVTWQFLSKITIGFSLWIKLHALIHRGSPRPVLTPVHGMEYGVGLDNEEVFC